MALEVNIPSGITCAQSKKVTDNDTAATFGSGLLAVYATPALVALMEHSAHKAVEHLLPEELTTVGVEMQVHHLKATPVGATVEARAVLEEVDGRRLVFQIEAHDDAGLIGTARHVRFIVDRERFLRKVYPNG